MFFGPLDNPKNRKLPDLTRREGIALAPLVMLIFVIGLFPRIFTEPMHVTIEPWVRDFNARVEVPPVEQTTVAPKAAAPTPTPTPAAAQGAE
jgi:NADH:ubiquinone oxidoreductase subunit 4 (subunit M)